LPPNGRKRNSHRLLFIFGLVCFERFQTEHAARPHEALERRWCRPDMPFSVCFPFESALAKKYRRMMNMYVCV
jgi:hypothetical protein